LLRLTIASKAFAADKHQLSCITVGIPVLLIADSSLAGSPF